MEVNSNAGTDPDCCRLSPHEADDLDVILLGHSLGGILAADVALLQREEQPKHRILGLVNFDVPFLGLHPGVIPTGIRGLVPKKDLAVDDKVAEEQASLGLEPSFKPVTPSPNFDPPFKNDIRLVERGFFKGMLHFINKNTDNLSRSIFDRAVSSYKFAGCVNNYTELRRRYRRLMELESAEYSPHRVRFVNYYTTSTGRIPQKNTTELRKEAENEAADNDQVKEPATDSLEYLSETVEISKHEEIVSTMNNTTIKEADPGSTTSRSPTLTAEETKDENNCSQPDPTNTDSSTTIEQKENQQSSEGVSITASESKIIPDVSKQKPRKFILLPSHHWKWDNNAHWMPLFMDNMDEVTAHQSMFVPQGANYDQLVGDSVALIEQWVQNDLSRRLLQEALD